eukprot:4087241-Prymnesium_polylepis.2
MSASSVSWLACELVTMTMSQGTCRGSVLVRGEHDGPKQLAWGWCGRKAGCHLLIFEDVGPQGPDVAATHAFAHACKSTQGALVPRKVAHVLDARIKLLSTPTAYKLLCGRQ